MSGLFGRRSGQHGFTFNEILVAIAITGLAVLGYAATTITMIHGNRTSENYTVAINLAHDKLEQLRGQVRLLNENRCPGDTSINARGVPGGIFNRCWKIADSTLATNLKQVEVSVTWRDTEARVLTFTTLLYQE
jgi:prepilin-type N-terminal cleavage/methylation domain-containing protein